MTPHPFGSAFGKVESGKLIFSSSSMPVAIKIGCSAV